MKPLDLVTKLAAGEAEARDALETLVAEAVEAAGAAPQAQRAAAIFHARRALGIAGLPENPATRRAFAALVHEPVEAGA